MVTESQPHIASPAALPGDLRDRVNTSSSMSSVRQCPSSVFSLKSPEDGFYLRERVNRRGALNPGNNPRGEEGRKGLPVEIKRVRITAGKQARGQSAR